MNYILPASLATTLAFSCFAALAQDPPRAVVSTGAGSQVQTQLTGSFSNFAGSEDNARSLVTGLRQGSEITLTSPESAPGTGGTSTTFTPPTRPMGYGNVRIALSLAREQLVQQGITQPTPLQIRTALLGGTVTTNGTTSGAGSTVATSPGVLQMRADGMGWGQIANSMGVKLGHVMSGKTPQPVPQPAVTTASGVSSGNAAGVATAAGGQGRGNGVAASQTHRPGSGIVTAAGGSAGAGYGANARAGGGGAMAGNGVVSAGGRTSAMGLSNGKGHSKP